MRPSGRNWVMPVILTISLLASVWGASTSFAAEEMNTNQKTELSTHWAGKTLKEWMAKGWIRSDVNGSVQPDRPILRGEMMAFANRAFDLTEKAEIAFSDLSPSDWEYDEASIAVKTGYIQGYEDGTIRVRNQITRQEVATLLAGMLQLESNAANRTTGATSYKDQAQIAGWSQQAVASMTTNNIIDGYGDGSFRPQEWVTRAEAIVMLDRAKVRQGDQLFEEAGTFGPKHVTQIVNGNVSIKAGGVTLRNMIINGDVLIDAGDGEIFWDGLEVSGTVTIIQAGKVTLSGNLSRLEIASPAAEIDIKAGSIRELYVTEKAAGANVNVDQLGHINKLMLAGSIHVAGEGEIQQAIIQKGAETSTFARQPNRKELPAASSSTTTYYDNSGGSGSGGGAPVTDPNEQPLTPDYDAERINSNSSFEVGTGTDGARNWTAFFNNKSGGSNILRSSEQAYSDNYSMKAIAVQSGGFFQSLHLQPGNYSMSASYFVPEISSAEGTLQLFVQFMDDRGRWLSEAVSEVWPSQYDKGQWNTFHWTLQVPESVSGQPVKIAQIGVELKGFNANEMIYVDDVKLRKSSKAPVSVHVASMSADNGMIRAILNENPDNPPVVRDFHITRIDRVNDSTIYPTSIGWDETTRTVALTIPNADTSAIEQRVKYRVAYKGSAFHDDVEIVIPPDPSKPFNANPSFEGYLDASWYRWFEQADNYTSTKMERSYEKAATGKYSLKASDVKYGAPYQNVTVTPGNYKLSVSYYTAENMQTDGMIGLTVNYRNSTSYVGTISDEKQRVQATSGNWHTIEWLFEVPETFNGMPVEHIQISALLEGFREGEAVFVDDFELIKLGSLSNVQIANVTAENGTIQAVLDSIPSIPPVLQDFAVKQIINNGEETVIIPSAIVWDESAKTVVLTIPNVAASGNEQRVVYRVAYKQKPAIQSNEVIIPADPAASLTSNPSFEAPLENNWSIWFDRVDNFAGTNMERSTEFALTGEHSLKAIGVKIGAPYQYVHITPGTYTISVSYYTPANMQTDGTINFSINFYDAGYISSIADVKHNVRETSGSWHTIEWTFEVPETYNGRVVERLQLSAGLYDFAEGEAIFIDDLNLSRKLDN